MRRYRSQDCIQRPNAQHRMRRDRDALMLWRLRLQDDVTTGLVNFDIVPVAAKAGRKASPTQITREFHGKPALPLISLQGASLADCKHFVPYQP
jgi:hypothetical protein